MIFDPELLVSDPVFPPGSCATTLKNALKPSVEGPVTVQTREPEFGTFEKRVSYDPLTPFRDRRMSTDPTFSHLSLSS